MTVPLPMPLLIVEDEPTIRMLLEEALEDGGFSVVVAETGERALHLLANDSTFSGLITDIRLGEGPSGWEVARHAREINPCMAVVYITGDSAQDWPANGVPKSVVVQKPFAIIQLVTAISTLLNESASSLPPSSD